MVGHPGLVLALIVPTKGLHLSQRQGPWESHPVREEGTPELAAHVDREQAEVSCWTWLAGALPTSLCLCSAPLLLSSSLHLSQSNSPFPSCPCAASLDLSPPRSAVSRG